MEKKDLVYKTPYIDGVRRIIRRARNLREDEKKYASILFPSSKLATKHTIEHEDEASKRVPIEVENTKPVPDTETSLKPVEKKKNDLERSAQRLVQETRACDGNLTDQIPFYIKRLNDY